MQYEYKMTRITPNNNVLSEGILNELGKQGYAIVAWAPFSLDVVLVMQREVKAPLLEKAVSETKRQRQVTVKAEE